MKTPRFWNSKSALSSLLLPLAALYDMIGTARRAFVTPVVPPVPVICIGNVTAGGAGKTPVALHIGQRLRQKNIAAFFLSRGYGGTLPGPVLVDPVRHTVREVGDEPLLLARVLPTVIAKDRVAGARFAIAQGAKAIIMDDGFQNPSLAKTLSLLVIDGQTGMGNGRLIPAGPLRELLAEGLKRAQAAVVINATDVLPPWPAHKPVLYAKTRLAEDLDLRGKKLLAFCGIATPQKFFAMLASLGAHLTGTVAFADHYAYRESDLKVLMAQAARAQATLVTTAKDAVRLPDSLRQQVRVIDITLAFENEALLDTLLDIALKRP